MICDSDSTLQGPAMMATCLPPMVQPSLSLTWVVSLPGRAARAASL